ncbi:acetyltransferase [Oerskovia turbata]|uniref:Acetyltransferase n=1 Tax=Oerskovia turbata TaxID=1713 RepID=A0A4Q1L0T0_9CELL|nr:GNAT family N-acetyltransferase [Oerskovia turbata]RXR25128.1 acetyltransferase [Oerskovia turbata]RXR35274.1 acetyltransferase [Oerskovia turbata]TGJ95248.1 acetyltransferase [Actinotalea fermentans ATCC 43279 = JCM 9966 = DSM 3133]
MTDLIVLPATSEQAVVALADGARVVARSWAAELRADAVDLGLLERAQHAVRGVVSLRELTAADRQAILVLDRDTHRDYPGSIATQHRPLTADTAAPSARRRGFAAFAEAELVAMTFVDIEGGCGETDFTVVAASWRGQGLATAVKALSIDTLIAGGVHTFRTGGSLDNQAIVAANRNLGYVQDEEWLTLAVDSGGSPSQD